MLVFSTPSKVGFCTLSSIVFPVNPCSVETILSVYIVDLVGTANGFTLESLDQKH